MTMPAGTGGMTDTDRAAIAGKARTTDGTTTTDKALMRRVAAGDEAAFTELVARFGPRLFSVARRLLRSPADAEDAVQRAFMQCFTGARAYRPEWAVSTWLYRILTNLCIDQLRRRTTGRAVREAAAREARAGQAGWVAGMASSSGGLEGRPGHDRRLDVERALLRVPREARVLLALRYADGLSYDELARARGISINTVKSQLARGKSILRAALEGD